MRYFADVSFSHKLCFILIECLNQDELFPSGFLLDMYPEYSVPKNAIWSSGLHNEVLSL
jgi:hypothetical protein